jgi:hypothetical protein
MKVDVMVLVGHFKRIWRGILINIHLSAANFKMNLVVGSRAYFKLMKLIVNSWMKTNMIVRAWHKDRLASRLNLYVTLVEMLFCKYMWQLYGNCQNAKIY